MSALWREEDEEFKVGGVKGGLKAKPRFSFTEVKLLLEAVKRNRYILLRKFNQGVSAETKKQTWTEITNQINSLGENHREVRQIMKKWADLKCDGKRRALALRSPNGSNLRKKNLGPIERMVHKILIMSPRAGGDSDLDFGEDEEFSKLYNKGPPPNSTPYSYLSMTDSSHSVPGGASFDLSPLSSPEKELDECTLDYEENDDSLFSSYPSSLPPPSSASPTSLDPLPDNALLRMKPVHTYSRNSQNQTQSYTSPRPPPPGPSSSVASTSLVFSSVSDSDTALSAAAPPSSQSPTSSNMTASSLPAPPPSSSSSSTTVASHPAPSFSSILPPPAPPAAVSSSSSNSHQPSPSSASVLPPNHPSTSGSNHEPLPAGASSRRAHDNVAQMASQGLQQQRASRMLLTSVSQSLEVLAQSVQLLVESQHEFVQDSLQLQRETVDILRDFSNTALTMLRDKANSGQLATHPPPAAHF
ncbi:flocculation protein FLO11 isoform X2 [Cottoperca gobio]|uniref:Flocculation protein FLO11 isoform X2 n=1 Tax=Cottoperca gobio TaxID=56716 RepID=A0A6J2R081_COTGO|nr:flocculation protein FLO11-like isoform X2 [Cottoperca gobio]